MDSGGNPDGSGDQSKPDEFNPLSFAYQPFGQMAPENFVRRRHSTAGQCGTDATQPSQQPAGVDGPTASSMAYRWHQRVQGPASEAARAALAEAAALAGRLAPAAARAASGPAAALSALVTPANSQGEIIDLGDGLRARLSPGQVRSRSSGERTTVCSEQALARAGRPCRLMPNCAWKRAVWPVFSSITGTRGRSRPGGNGPGAGCHRQCDGATAQ